MAQCRAQSAARRHAYLWHCFGAVPAAGEHSPRTCVRTRDCGTTWCVSSGVSVSVVDGSGVVLRSARATQAARDSRALRPVTVLPHAHQQVPSGNTLFLHRTGRSVPLGRRTVHHQAGAAHQRLSWRSAQVEAELLRGAVGQRASFLSPRPLQSDARRAAPVQPARPQHTQRAGELCHRAQRRTTVDSTVSPRNQREQHIYKPFSGSQIGASKQHTNERSCWNTHMHVDTTVTTHTIIIHVSSCMLST